MALETPIESDCAPLHGLVDALLAAAPGTRFLRDATRGGVATVLNEIAEASQVAIEIDEDRDAVARARSGASARSSASIRSTWPTRARSSPSFRADRRSARWRRCARIRLATGCERHRRGDAGEPGRCDMQTVFGGRRIVDMLVGEQLPRIC